MATEETYYYGQGKVEFAIIGAGGALGDWSWVGDVSAFSPKFAVEKVEHKESYSGKRGLVRSFIIGNTGTVDMTWHQLSPENLAIALQSTVVSDAGGSFSDIESPEDIAVGDVWPLGRMGVSAVTITDSTSESALPLTEGTHYTLDPNFGDVTVLDITGFELPLVAAGTAAGTKSVGMFAGTPPNIAVRYRGVNLAESNAPVEAVFYKMSTDPLQELALITTGNDVAGMQITANVLLDSSKPASGALGQFGYVKQIATVA